MISVGESQNFSLSNFEGPLDLLLYLVQKNELDIYDIPIHAITEQYLRAIENLDEADVDGGAEFLSMAATLLLIKSRMLLPKHEQVEGDDDDPDPRFEIIHQLLDYVRFKGVAQKLSEQEARQVGCFYRAVPTEEMEVGERLGVEHLTIAELEAVFLQVLERAKTRQGGLIDEEEWRVPDKLKQLRQAMRKHSVMPLSWWFSSERSKGELIVIFLAMLELMKNGELLVMRNQESEALEIRIPETTAGKDVSGI